jgi:hypothetical protein
VALHREDREGLGTCEGQTSRCRCGEVEAIGAPVLAGLKEARADIVAFHDDDVIQEPGWLWGLADPPGLRRVGCARGRVVGDDVSGPS